MKKIKKISVLLVFISFLSMIMSCDLLTGKNENSKTDGNDSLVSWTTEANGTLKIANNTAKDMVVFNG
jgi:hypothetical protein